jgi:hypothetical protein
MHGRAFRESCVMALPDDRLSSDRDPGGEHPCRYCVHGYHLLVLSHGHGKISSSRCGRPTGYSGGCPGASCCWISHGHPGIFAPASWPRSPRWWSPPSAARPRPFRHTTQAGRRFLRDLPVCVCCCGPAGRPCRRPEVSRLLVDEVEELRSTELPEVEERPLARDRREAGLLPGILRPRRLDQP